jgi:Ca2+-binding RTX toxin-like protein
MAAIRGTNRGDTIAGTAEDDHIDGLDGADMLAGREGDDWLSGGVGAVDHLWGGEDNDTYVIRDSLDVVHELANEGIDKVIATHSYTLTANVENLVLLAGSTGIGNDLGNHITGNAGDNTLSGGYGNDYLYGEAGVDTADFSFWDTLTQSQIIEFDLTAEAGHGRRYSYIGGPSLEIDSLQGIENIRGTRFDDIFRGTSTEYAYYADNEFWGRGGNDTFQGDMGRDTYHGDEGTDTVDYKTSKAGVTIDLRSGGTGGTAEGDRYTSIERAQGSAFDDRITGSDDDNRLTGMAGNDDIDGGIGNDTIIANADTDIEHLTGGSGRDTFVYLNRSDSNTTATRTGDYIMDFNVNDDLIDLRALGVNAANLLITNSVSGGVHFARILEDLNGNGAADADELSINLIVETTANVTLEDVLI